MLALAGVVAAAVVLPLCVRNHRLNSAFEYSCDGRVKKIRRATAFLQIDALVRKWHPLARWWLPPYSHACRERAVVQDAVHQVPAVLCRYTPAWGTDLGTVAAWRLDHSVITTFLDLCVPYAPVSDPVYRTIVLATA
jgi:hypothetical protein